MSCNSCSKDKFVYFFGEGKAEGAGTMKDVLGGKGAGLAEMTNAGLPVPPGFTISTAACTLYYDNEKKLSGHILSEIDAALARLEGVLGRRLGSTEAPLLVSVRSGAKFSMPGMMDTILNLGLNDDTVLALEKSTGNPRFAWDCYRRFIQMFSDVVLGVSKKEMEHLIDHMKHERGVKQDIELNADDMKELAARFRKYVFEKIGREFPQDTKEQLMLAVNAVFESWNNDRAIHYRNMNDIPHTIGTAVNVQAMVFGNTGETSGSGVGFTRNPSTGAREFYGEYLPNAQGEDVVAGIRTPFKLEELRRILPHVYDELKAITDRLEKHYRDMQDFEFTVQEGKLFMLQTRNGKRTGAAAVKVACDMVDEGLISIDEAILKVEPQQLDQLLHPVFAAGNTFEVIAKGLPASPGAAVGRIVFSSEDAVAMTGKKEKVVLVRLETCPDDIHGMEVSQGILTARGGMTSHAAVVARGMGIPCVAGSADVKIDEDRKTIDFAGGLSLTEGDYISLDGSKGEVYVGQLKTSSPDLRSGDFGKFMTLVDKVRTLKVRTNADIPRDAKVAREFGAEGIGLCRTEHMFFAPDRLPHMQAMILARTVEAREEALAKLLPMQREDFLGIFRVMDGYPVTIRTLDPPLHEFLPKREELMVEVAVMKERKAPEAEIEEKEKLLARVEELHEFNPMMGLRGCRLGIVYPEMTRMQARAILEAACIAKKEGVNVLPEIMIPLVGRVSELKCQADIVRETAEKVFAEQGFRVEFMVGTMIEIPRAAVTADEIAGVAEFFSFGTNDLTQMTFGYSRDDAGVYIREYLKQGILEKDPFQILDRDGVGQLVKMAVERGRKGRPGIKLGICGEHGGEPSSVEFCHLVGLNYVSCSPYRVPIARLAAAQSVAKTRVDAGTQQK
ncbi:MAG: pyruvate, phosphate dikinase [Acidobacteria bacterium]|nr:pyruvate, phosphate dikinase [Acidobacteriota bacterium]